ncbi:cytosolic Fe-S cluster assembly factor NARFL-like protein [Glomus cerebriforme]|uniref:Cytosolic Fe-S cluster assembly factor NARFL-like protein n=1 Tax=Glomus cerebriforme TaxID=658196 RepID=A0A397TK62_9GLOM|nr:cytosolic Fe-S cluster assembly factor NARFL-like protein [Glomus cerebriforme]
MSVILKDLNDYIAPSQACIKPVEVKKTNDDKNNVIKIDDSGGYYEVSQEGIETKLQTAQITLDDCLACSGCITSAESVLITMQSREELYNVLKLNKEAIDQNNLDQKKTVVISMAPQSIASIAAKYDLTPLQVAKRLTHFFKSLGVHYVFDTSFSRDFSLLESAREFVERYQLYQEKQQKKPPQDNNIKSTKIKRNGTSENDGAMNEAKLPMLASACPGWICYAEKTHGFILPYISQTKSPQQIMGSVVKDHLANKLGIKPNNIYHVGVMMCFDKKLEASRPDFFNDYYQVRDVDCVITTGEVDKMFEENNFDIKISEESLLDSFIKTSQEGALLRSSGSSSGGYLEFILEYAARELFNITGVDVEKEQGVIVKIGRNKDFKEVTLEIDGKPVLKFASAYGFRNIQNLVRKIKSSNSPYHYVEVMACPSGCINGGGQLKPDETIPMKDWISQVNNIYRNVNSLSPEKNDVVLNLYSEWLDGINSEKSKKLLRTQYHAVEITLVNPLAVKW